MPLSEHEQRLFDQIEQNLYADDPKFASSVRRARTRSKLRRPILLGITGIVLGLGLVLVGLLTNVIVLSVLGFVLVVGGITYATQTLRGRSSSTASAQPSAEDARAPRNQRSNGIRARMEERLRKRFDES